MAPKKKLSAFEEELIIATEHVQKRDKKLGKIIDQVGPCLLKLEEMHSPFASLAEAIIYQQLSGKAAATISQRVKNLFLEDGLREEAAKQKVLAAPRNRTKSELKKYDDLNKDVKPMIAATTFPQPYRFLETTDELLRSAGLSRAKTAAIKDLALKATEGQVPTLEEMHMLSDEELVERLSAIRGIGKWTVEMLLIFRLGRLNILPATDYGVRKGFAYTYKTGDLPTPSALMEYGEKWQPYRTVAAWYLWRAAGMAKI
jgi:3-methyladenine DNA glycosylase/8-oxoguanine DNA glycosylase